MYSQGMSFQISIACDQCHRAAPGAKCVFCSGTKVAGIVIDDRKRFEEAVWALGEKVLEAWEWRTVDGKGVKTNVRGPRVACSKSAEVCVMPRVT